jgi:hypothetical protein
LFSKARRRGQPRRAATRAITITVALLEVSCRWSGDGFRVLFLPSPFFLKNKEKQEQNPALTTGQARFEAGDFRVH